MSFAATRQTFSLRRHLDFIARHITEDNDAFIIIDGYEGSGKSKFSQDQARYVASVNNVEVSPAPITDGGNIVYAGQMFEDFMAGVKELPEFSPVIADELQWLAFSRNARGENSRLFTQVLMTIRDRHLAMFGCLPKRHWADIYIRGHRAQTWWYVYTLPMFDFQGHLHMQKGYADFQYGRESKWAPEIRWEEGPTVQFPAPEPDDDFWKKYQKNKKEFREALIESLTGGKDGREERMQEARQTARRMGDSQARTTKRASQGGSTDF